MKINRWKVYCETEAQWKTWYLHEDDAPPTKCPDHAAHVITPGSASIGLVIDQCVVMHKQVLHENSLKMRALGIQFTAAGGQETIHDHVISEALKLKGGCLVVDDNWNFGDTATMQIIDKDNVLGYGENVVVAKYATDWNVHSDPDHNKLVAEFVSDTLPAGLYVRLKYKSTGTISVQVGLNLIAYKEG